MKFLISTTEKIAKTTIMYDFAAKATKILEPCKMFSTDLVKSLNNILQKGKPIFSVLEVFAFSMAAKSKSIDSESRSFKLLKSSNS